MENLTKGMDSLTTALVADFMLCEGIASDDVQGIKGAIKTVEELRENLGEADWFTLAYYKECGGDIEMWEWSERMFNDSDFFIVEFKNEFLQMKGNFEKALGEEITHEQAFKLCEVKLPN